MKDIVAKSWALHYGATVLPYQQDPATCAALCALWIRKQLKDGTIFNPKRLWRAPESVPQSELKAARVLFDTSEEFDSKIFALRVLISEQTAFNSVENNYITEGSRSPGYQKGLKDIKDNRHVATVVDRLPRDAIGEKASGILATFKRTRDEKCLASIGYDMRSDEGRQFMHAVALDCSKVGNPVFFDPLIGQFSFPTFENFTIWWRTCWKNRNQDNDATGNAWSDIRVDGCVEATLYGNE